MDKHIMKYGVILLLILSNISSFSQCPQLYNNLGTPSSNPYWYSCSGNNYTLNINSPNIIGSWTVDWGDGSPISSGVSLIPPATISHLYTAVVDTFNVVFTETSSGCIINGVLVMEKATSASIQIPVGGLTQTCAPSALEFINSSTNTSQTTVFTWNFGDGSPPLVTNYTNAGVTNSHMYLQGTVNCVTQVTLSASNYCNILQGGPSIATFNPIRIWDIDDAAINASAILLCYPDTQVSFTNITNRNCLAQGNIAQRYEWWNFGDYWGNGYDSIRGWIPWPPALPYTMAYPGIGTYNVMMVDSSFCGLDTAFITVQIVAPPFAAISSSNDTICQGQTVTFNNLSGGGANAYSWNFGDGTGWFPSAGGNVTHTYNISGDYIIKLVANITGGTGGCSDTASINLHVFTSPVANFTFDNNNGCDSMYVNFSNTASADAISWSWIFGNTNTSTLPNPPTQFYGVPGTYNVQLTVQNLNGCSHVRTKTIRVYQSPVPAFTPTSVCANSMASFTDNSTFAAGDPILTWNWDFGDGFTSTQQNPTHVYASSGFYDMILTVNTAFCTGKDTVQINVENVPTANFTSSINNGCADLFVNFTNASSVNAVNFIWIFGDGSPNSNAVNTNHTFINSFGYDTTYYVKLIALTSFGCSDTISQPVTVYPNPNASFTDNAILDCAPLIVNFSNTSTGAVSQTWNFGDTSPLDNSLSPSHTYQNLTQFINNYIVELISMSINGCVDTIRKNITVYPEPQFGFSSVPDSGCSPLAVNFPSVIGAVVYNWDFGDGTTGSGPTPSHTYINNLTNNLVYNITLYATSPFGCKDTTNGQVLVFPNPSAQFTTNLSVGCSPLPVTFTNSSTGGALYHWNLGDGTTFDTLSSNFNHTYLNSSGVLQNINTNLIAETDRGCKDTASSIITLYPEIKAITQFDTSGCSPFTTTFNNLSSGAQNYYWNFGDGSPLNITPSPSHIFTNSTSVDITFNINLIAESIYGCRDTLNRIVLIHPKPVASFVAAPSIQTFPSSSVSILNSSSFGVWQYNWNYGDNTSSILQNPPIHNYATWGNYDIRLIVSGTYCADTVIETIRIIPPVPVANFLGPLTGCRPLPVQFTNNSIYANQYTWNFGDGGVSTQTNPIYTYYNPGTYSVTLTAIGDGGTDVMTQIQIIEVYPVPTAFFTVAPTSVTIPSQAISLYNLSAFGSSYFWDFGDGNSSTLQNPQHYYTQPGFYDISLITISLNNCTDTFRIISAVEASAEGSIKIPNAFTPNPGGSNGGIITIGSLNNDVFHPILFGVETYQLNIFNKWGELLFVSKDINIGWDGYYKEKLVPQDVYVYKIQVTFVSGKSETYVGDINLLR